MVGALTGGQQLPLELGFGDVAEFHGGAVGQGCEEHQRDQRGGPQRIVDGHNQRGNIHVSFFLLISFFFICPEYRYPGPRA